MIKNIFILLTIISFITGCNQKISYSGKIMNNEIKIQNIKSKKELINLLGNPNYIDPIEKKYLYFGEKILTKNNLNIKTIERKIYLFNFDVNDNIIDLEKFFLDDKKNIKLSKDKTKNYLIKRGIIEKIFGGVGSQQLPTNSN